MKLMLAPWRPPRNLPQVVSTTGAALAAWAARMVTRLVPASAAAPLSRRQRSGSAQGSPDRSGMVSCDKEAG